MERWMQLVKREKEKGRRKLFQGMKLKREGKQRCLRKLNCSTSQSFGSHPRPCLAGFSHVTRVERAPPKKKTLWKYRKKDSW